MNSLSPVMFMSKLYIARRVSDIFFLPSYYCNFVSIELGEYILILLKPPKSKMMASGPFLIRISRKVNFVCVELLILGCMVHDLQLESDSIYIYTRNRRNELNSPNAQ